MRNDDPRSLLPGTELPQMKTEPPGPRSRALAERLRSVESRNVTYVGPDFPVFWDKARGANVRDADGNVYVDLSGAFGVAAAGHANPRVTEATARQAGRLVHAMGDVHPPVRKVELLERLAEAAPWAETRGILGSSGSEAVEAALKTAYLATGRPGILAFKGGYHGLTLGSLAATAREDFREPFRPRLYQGVAFAPYPHQPTQVPEDGAGSATALEAVEEALVRGIPPQGGGDPVPVGAVLVEPLQGRGGVRIPPEGFLRQVAELARRHGALVIFDEIFTGLGRTGRFFAFQHEGVVPDLLCLGKALGGGFPLSACLGPREVMDAWPESRGEALHTSTFLGHPVACAAALAVLDELKGRNLVARSNLEGERLRRSLAEGLADHPVRVWGRGLFLGLGPQEPSAPANGMGFGVRLARKALNRGLLALPAGDHGEVLQLAPPLVITREQLEHAAAELTALAAEEAGDVSP